MFSNDLIRGLCRNSDETRLVLSQDDYHRVLAANKAFYEEESEQQGSEPWGACLLVKARIDTNALSLKPALELCAGSGFLYLSLRGRIEAINDACFIDLSDTQCDAFRNRAGMAGETNGRPKIIRGDIGRLPFLDDTFGLVYGNSFLHHLPDVPSYLREANRVMRQSGMLVIFHEPTPRAPFWESFPVSLVKDTRTNSLTDIWLIEPQTLHNLLSEAGFKSIQIMPGGLLAALLLNPLLIVMNKIARRKRGAWVPRVMKWFLLLERVLPNALLSRMAPSLAIVAIK